MSRLGKFQTGKSCLYLKRLSDVDPAALRELLRSAVTAMKSQRILPGASAPANRSMAPSEKTAKKQTATKKAPAQKTPAQKTPAQKTPAQKTPAQKTPAQKTPAQKTPAQKSTPQKSARSGR
jgi:hypothetical protein